MGQLFFRSNVEIAIEIVPKTDEQSFKIYGNYRSPWNRLTDNIRKGAGLFGSLANIVSVSEPATPSAIAQPIIFLIKSNLPR
jgi:F420-0:gamma-glutamyl ligase-like protein